MKTYRTWLTAILPRCCWQPAPTRSIRHQRRLLGPASASPPPRRRSRCVRTDVPSPNSHQRSLRPQDGDTVTIGAGTYRGGVVVQASVADRGAGTEETIIRGGGPVITIGEYEADAQPTVTIEGVTITGGLTRIEPGLLREHGEGRGDGTGRRRRDPQSAGRTLGATVTITQQRHHPQPGCSIGHHTDRARMPSWSVSLLVGCRWWHRQLGDVDARSTPR